MHIADSKASFAMRLVSIYRSYLLLIVAAAVLPLSLTGCPSKSGTVRISGNASFKGQPIPGGIIVFYPAQGRAISASIKEDGNYSIDLDPGDYIVTVDVSVERPPGFKEGDKLPPPKMVLPPEYTTRARSKLTASVSKDGNRIIDFALK
jgi:hypothetical protein